MKKLKNWRTASFLLWIMVTAIITLSMPNLDQLVREKGQITIPDDKQSTVAEKMIKDMSGEDNENYSIIVVFNSGSHKKLTSNQKEEISSAVHSLQNHKKELDINKIVSHLDNKQTKEQLVSKDGTTILTQLSIEQNNKGVSEVAKDIHKFIKINDVDTYLTGNKLVIEDYIQSSQDGIKKTEVIAVIFIIAVLILVFRSPIVPVISLLSVGVSYLVSLGIIAHLVDRFNYPFSNFTQVFLVVILFGIGTDYNILLFTRFKEELVKQDNVLAAVKETYKTAGHTVLFSALAVFTGFTALILAEFVLYRAISAVAIGVAVLVLVLMTLNPFFMVLLGKNMFWPIKKFEGHSESKIWALLSKVSVMRPIIALLFIAVLCVPFILTYSSSSSYNDLLELDNKYPSKQGINVIEDHFSPGFSSPTTLVIKSSSALDNAKSLQSLDELAERIKGIDGVDKVMTATRPTGEKIKDLYIQKQTKDLHNGLGDANEGVSKINKGLSSAEKQVGQADSSGTENIQALINGTHKAKQGVSSLGNAINQLSNGISSGKDGAQELENGLASLKENMNTLGNSIPELMNAYSALQQGLSSYSSSFASLSQAIDGTEQGYEQIESSMKALIKSKPELAHDVNVQTALGVASAGKKQLAQLSEKLNSMTPQYNRAMQSFKKANSSLAQVNSGYSQLQTGVNKLYAGSTTLKNGLQSAADGSSKIASQTPTLESGLTTINDGQKQLLAGINDLSEQMKTLQSGLAKSSTGLKNVSSGLNDAQGYLKDLSKSDASEKFYIPEDVLKSDDFQKSLNMYMSDDRKFAQMNIILDVNPYSKKAMTIVKNIEDAVQGFTKNGALSDTQIAFAGKTAQNVDLQDISSSDLKRTATIMLISIGLILIFITRSLFKPILIISSLLLTYFTALGMSEMLSQKILNVDELGWNVPFFSFIMIVALGVDYSIFLMMRYSEHEGRPTEKIIEAARHIGGVVISAAIILGGTFAALIPSGVITLIEVAITVIIGLFLLSFVMLPIFIPSLLSMVSSVRNIKWFKKLKRK